MVIESLGTPSSGALAFTLRCVEDLLLRETRPWAIIEGNDGAMLYPPAFSRALRQKMAEGRLLWVRVPEKEIPEVFLKLLQSALFSGVLLRAFEVDRMGQKFLIWLRRWQLASERSGTHWLWQHQKPCPRLGLSVALSWKNKTNFELLKGHSFFESCDLKIFEELRLKRKISAETRQRDGISGTHPATA